MEHSRKFELDQALRDYVQSMHDGQLSKSDRKELLDHLEEEVHNLQLTGLSAQESFLIGKLRFGDDALINREYRKVRPVFTFNQLVLKAIFLCISFSMVLSLSPYLSFFSANTFAKIWDTSSYGFMLSDLGIKSIFIAGSFYAFYYWIFRRYRMNVDFYIAALIIYILVGMVLYFTFGHLPALERELRALLWKNTLWINSAAMFSLIFYNLYLTFKESDSESAKIIESEL